MIFQNLAKHVHISVLNDRETNFDEYDAWKYPGIVISLTRAYLVPVACGE